MTLDKLPLRTAGGYNVIVETLRHSKVKFAYEPESGVFVAKKLLAMGLHFPFAFGFFPSTRGEDGDPLDVLLITDAPLPMGCLVHCRLIGVIMAKQGSSESETVRNDRLLGVPLLHHQDRPPFDIGDLPDHELDDIEDFFRAYQRADGKIVDFIGRGDGRQAENLLSSGAL